MTDHEHKFDILLQAPRYGLVQYGCRCGGPTVMRMAIQREIGGACIVCGEKELDYAHDEHPVPCWDCEGNTLGHVSGHQYRTTIPNCESCKDPIDDENEAWMAVYEDFFHQQCLSEENKGFAIAFLVDALNVTGRNE